MSCEVNPCGICLEPLTNVDRPICEGKHIFHSPCVQEWIETCKRSAQTPTCPTCRRNITVFTPTAPPRDPVNQKSFCIREESEVFVAQESFSDLVSRVQSQNQWIVDAIPDIRRTYRHDTWVPPKDMYRFDREVERNRHSTPYQERKNFAPTIYRINREFENAWKSGSFEYAAELLRNHEISSYLLDRALKGCIDRGPAGFALASQLLNHESVSDYARYDAFRRAYDRGYYDDALALARDFSLPTYVGNPIYRKAIRRGQHEFANELIRANCVSSYLYRRPLESVYAPKLCQQPFLQGFWTGSEKSLSQFFQSFWGVGVRG